MFLKLLVFLIKAYIRGIIACYSLRGSSEWVEGRSNRRSYSMWLTRTLFSPYKYKQI